MTKKSKQSGARNITHLTIAPFPSSYGKWDEVLNTKNEIRQEICATIKFLDEEQKTALTKICVTLGFNEDEFYLSLFRKAFLGEDKESGDQVKMVDLFWYLTHRDSIGHVSFSKETFAPILPAIDAQLSSELRQLKKTRVQKVFFERIPEKLILPWFKIGAEFEIESSFTLEEMEKALTLGSSSFAAFVELRLTRLMEESVKSEIKKAGLNPDEPGIVKDRLYGRKHWTRTKAEFAQFVCDQYEMNRDRFPTLRQAAYQLFDEFAFDDVKWTKEKCYDYVRQF